MEEEIHKLTPGMKKFFEKLIDIKEFVKQKHAETKMGILKVIHERLDEVIKSTEEKKK